MRHPQGLLPVAFALLMLTESVSAQDPSLLQCLTWIHQGAYRTGIEQGWCEARFSLPDPFTLKCARLSGSEVPADPIERLACELHLMDLVKRIYRDFLNEEEFQRVDQGATAGFGKELGVP